MGQGEKPVCVKTRRQSTPRFRSPQLSDTWKLKYLHTPNPKPCGVKTVPGSPETTTMFPWAPCAAMVAIAPASAREQSYTWRRESCMVVSEN